jgi:hypothetical protein
MYIEILPYWSVVGPFKGIRVSIEGVLSIDHPVLKVLDRRQAIVDAGIIARISLTFPVLERFYFDHEWFTYEIVFKIAHPRQKKYREMSNLKNPRNET